MKVTYSIGAKFASSGIGSIAYHAVKEIYKSKALSRLLCSDYDKSDIPSEKIERFPFPIIIEKLPYYIKNIISSNFSPSSFKDKIYDYWTKSRVEKCDIFHGWNGQCLESIKKAKKIGSKIFLERASTHILYQNKVLNEEYKRFNIQHENIETDTIKRCIKEYELADKIIVPSKFVYDTFLKQNISKDKLVLAPFGVDSNRFKPEIKKDDVFRIIFVGQVCYRKGVQYLLKAFEELKLKNAELLIVGRILPEINNVIKNYYNRKDIVFINNSNKVEKEYQKSSIFVLPTIEEGSALVTYEAMSCGLPTIITENAGSVAKDGKDGFIIPLRDVEKLKEKILYCYNNKKEIRKMGLQARKTALKYPWENYGRRIIKAYNETLKI